MPELAIEVDDPLGVDVQALIQRHLSFAHAFTSPGDVYALDTTGLCQPGITVYGARVAGELLAIGAMRELDPTHGEVKSMHTTESARGQGLGRRMLEKLIAVARERGYSRLSLETGAQAAFLPARRLYAALGFQRCDRFAEYRDSPSSAFMTLPLDPR